jgi:bifunctional UDP-N-acetylglucosamine pyrophosphorylase / glucosamine-1-phosphate N-acetyltransferase
MTSRSCLSIILAAGEGTRMKSALPKVLHPIAGLPMVAHVARATAATGAVDIALVVGNGAEAVEAAVRPYAAKAESFVQAERLGTAHAALCAKPAMARGYDDVLVVFADTPLIDPPSLSEARHKLTEGASVVVLGFRPKDPARYGRLIEKDGQLVAIREYNDCTPEERQIGFCNGGLMAIDGKLALALLEAVGNDNAKKEYYLTDIVEIARARGLRVVATEVPYESVLGINTRVELAEAENIWQQRKRRELMLSGVTMIDPQTVVFAHDTEVDPDVLIEPNVFFGPGVKVAAKAKIRAFSHIEGAVVGPEAEVGPFARLRPGADLAEKSKVGNFCEVKKARVGAGAKVNHLSYIGDAVIGPKANIGAGTITCNYDGFNKWVTEIGAGAFVGSNSALVAPVRIGDGAYVASGSVIVESVPDDALAFGRARQRNLPDRGRQLRERLAAQAKK